MEMQSQTMGKLAAALCKAQGLIQGARKDSKNPFFKSMYADLASVTGAVREAFGACGLAYTQTFMPNETGPIIVTTLMHESGEWQRSELYIPATKLDPQQFGSAITYGRRYSLAAIAGVIQEDDDAESATIPSRTVSQDDAEKPWYNTLEKDRASMLARIDSGEYSCPQDIITLLEKKYRVSKKTKDLILGIEQ